MGTTSYLGHFTFSILYMRDPCIGAQGFLINALVNMVTCFKGAGPNAIS